MGKRKEDSDLHRIKLEAGTVYQTSKNGTYSYRSQVQKARKCVSLGTSNQEEAIRKAKALLPTVRADNLEVIATHVKVARPSRRWRSPGSESPPDAPRELRHLPRRRHPAAG